MQSLAYWCFMKFCFSHINFIEMFCPLKPVMILFRVNYIRFKWIYEPN